MSDFTHAITEGFTAPFILAAAIVFSIVGGAWRMFARLFGAFLHNQPLPVGPGRTLKLP